jgi:hypothetical protein
MNQHRPPDHIPPPGPAENTATDGWARWVRKTWEGVRVTHLEAVPLPASIRGRLRVRVNVHLAALTPADVLVEATAEGGEASGARGEWPIRLCSTQSYGNGTYVFDAPLPPQGVENQRVLTVRVRPAVEHPALSRLREVVRPFEVRTDAHASDDTRRSRPEPTAVAG